MIQNWKREKKGKTKHKIMQSKEHKDNDKNQREREDTREKTTNSRSNFNSSKANNPSTKLCLNRLEIKAQPLILVILEMTAH